MAGEIVNRVANSQLVNIDLESFYPSEKRMELDISQWLFEGLILREKDFRASVEEHDWNQYDQAHVAVYCSSDAIIPSWAFLLISTKLADHALSSVVGNTELLNNLLFKEIIDNLDLDPYRNRPVIIKGCSDKPIPDNAFNLLIQRLKPVVKSLMYGEACSNVPLYKKK